MDKEEIVKIDEKEELNVSTQRTEHLFISGSPRYLGSIMLYPIKPRTIVAFNGLLTLEISRLAPDRMSAFFCGALELCNWESLLKRLGLQFHLALRSEAIRSLPKPK